MATRSHGAPISGGSDVNSAPVSSPGPEVGDGSCRHSQSPQAKSNLSSSILPELILCGYAKTAGERNWQLWRARHSLSINSGRSGRLADFAWTVSGGSEICLSWVESPHMQDSF
jgi:hypothetical protein